MNKALRIHGFGDAVGAALGIKDRFGHGHGAAILDQRGIVLDLTVFTADHHSIDDALDWAYCFQCNDERATRLVLFSAVRARVRDLRESDLELFRKARRVFGECGVEIIDWIQADAEDVRSMAFTDAPGAWGEAP